MKSLAKPLLIVGILAAIKTAMSFALSTFMYYQLYLEVGSTRQAMEVLDYGEAYKKLFIYSLMASIAGSLVLMTNVLEYQKRKRIGTIQLLNILCICVFMFDFIYVVLANFTGKFNPHLYEVARIFISLCLVGIVAAIIPLIIWLLRNRSEAVHPT